MDLLKRLKSEELDEEKLELSLGLSSNGRFGVERRRSAANGISGDNHNNNCNNNNNKNRLIRACSVSGLSNLTPESDDPTSLTLYPALTRTSSLPIEPEVEWKKRKELQSLRRSEAKRKRVEKIRSGRVVNETSRLPPLPRPVQVGSPASGGSSGVSDMESQPVSGTDKEIELKSTATQQPVSHQISSSNAYRSNSIPSQTTINGNMSKDATLKMMFADMPCVTTKGDGVNGKKIEGFLYRYRKGEEVRIVCVCHGSFLTPAEFVKHGGGGDVEHPLRHIVVIPPSI